MEKTKNKIKLVKKLSNQSVITKDDEHTISIHELALENHSTDVPLEPLKRPRAKQLKTSIEEYRQQFLQVPKITDRKPVFVSSSTRDFLNYIVRQLGGNKMSVSGFIENLALHHIKTYKEDILHHARTNQKDILPKF